MAAHLSLCAALALSLGAPSGLAQTLSDPTRPPPEILGGRPAAAPRAVATSPAPAPGYSPAQVVIISKERHQATIDGQTVKLGGRYRDATVIGITDEEIVLQRPESIETIRLYSSVQRTRRGPAARQPSGRTGNREGG